MSTPLLILNGSTVQVLQVNNGHNVFGPGWRANATIGRAVQLALVNIGGAQPGVLDKAMFGHPGEIYLLYRRERGGQPLGAAARRARVSARRQYGDGLPSRSAS